MSLFQGLEHGGRLTEAVARWGIPREQWLDLSTGINPRGWPVPTIPPEVWQRLPEQDDGLAALICQHYGAPSLAACVPVAGSQAAIQALPLLRRPCRVGIPVPGYQEHAHCWAKAGHQVVPVALERLVDDAWLADLDVLVWINPNNPTGLAMAPQRLLAWYEQLRQRDGWLVVDEAFGDGYDNLSLAPWTGRGGLVVMRSLGKFFGLAGLRAGAVLTDEALATRLAEALGPWALSGPARYLMGLALQDDAWRQATRTRLRQDRERLANLLRRHGLGEPSGTLLFQYVRIPDVHRLADHLAQQCILVRRFESPQALRFGLPATEADWRKLEQALASRQI